MTDRAREIAHERCLAECYRAGWLFAVAHSPQCDALTADIARYGAELLERHSQSVTPGSLGPEAITK